MPIAQEDDRPLPAAAAAALALGRVAEAIKQARMQRSLIRWVLVIDAIIVAAVLWWFFGR
ncbi:MAG: hypothetical protein ACT4UQ_02775 [Gammaproteobacteria bacterium]